MNMDEQYKFEASAYLNHPVDDDEEDEEVQDGASLLNQIPNQNHVQLTQHTHFTNLPQEQSSIKQEQDQRVVQEQVAENQEVREDQEEQQEEEEEEGEEAEEEEEEEEDMMGDSAFANVAQGLTGHYRNLMMNYWQETINSIEHEDHDFKNHQLPLARIKKVMKTDEEVKMISAEAPILFAKGCDIFITELTMRAWIHAEENKRRTLQRSDIAAALQQSDMFDFLIDIVPREEEKKTTNSNGNNATKNGTVSRSYATQTYTNNTTAAVMNGNIPQQQHDMNMQNMIFDNAQGDVVSSNNNNNNNNNGSSSSLNHERTFIQENVQHHDSAWSV